MKSIPIAAILVAAMIILPITTGTKYEGGTPPIKLSAIDKANLDNNRGLVIVDTFDTPNGPVKATYWGKNTRKPGKVALPAIRVLSSQAAIPNGGNPLAYALYGYRWNAKDPQIKLVIKNDARMQAEGLSASAVQCVIAKASESWDAATGQNLFADSGMVSLNPLVVPEKFNRINTISWRPFGTTCLGYARTYYKLDNVGGYHSVLDADVVFNSDYSWRTDGSHDGVDVQTATLHEIGHALGLGDIYDKPEFKYETSQAMHYYTDVKRTLGNGDKAGISKLYP